MSYWSHNPELYDEIITKALPNKWRKLVESDEISLSEVPEDIFFKASEEGEADYWGSKADEAMMQHETAMDEMRRSKA